MVVDVDVVVLLELLKQAIAHTMTAVATTPPTIRASLERNIAACSPAGGPGGNSGAAAGGGEGAGVSLTVPLDVASPEAPAPPLSPWASLVGGADAPVAVCAAEAVIFALSIEAANASANQFRGIKTLVFRPTNTVKRIKEHKAA